MLKTAIAHSKELDSADAVEDVLEQCRETLGELQAHAGMLFTGIDHDFALILNKINEAYPGIELIGCTTWGEISSVHGVADDSIVLTLFHSDEIEFKAGVADDLCIITPAAAVEDSEGFKVVNMDEVVDGLKQDLGETFPIFGGVAVNVKSQNTYQFYSNKVYTDAAPFLLIAGPVLFSLGVESGWMPIGTKTKVSRADGVVVYKIGDQTALEFYKHYIGEFDWEETVEYPLAIFEDDENRFYLRSPGNIDAEDESLTFGGTIPEGATVQLTHTTRDKAVEAAKESVKSAVAEYPGSNPSVALCFTCVARKIVLGSRVEEEYQVLNTNFPDLPVAGFYTGGEIGPLGRGRPSRYHNISFFTLLIGVE